MLEMAMQRLEHSCRRTILGTSRTGSIKSFSACELAGTTNVEQTRVSNPDPGLLCELNFREIRNLCFQRQQVVTLHISRLYLFQAGQSQNTKK
jgi:hypothetical protein